MTTENDVIKKMRKTAMKLKTNKTGYAEKTFSALELVRVGVKGYHESLQLRVNQAGKVLALIGEVQKDSALKTQVITLIGNCVQDAANRVNEAANVLEAALKNKAISNNWAGIKQPQNPDHTQSQAAN